MNIFVNSLKLWISNCSINSIIVMIMTIFMLIGAIDKIGGNKKGYGEKFDEGFMAMGPLALAMVGVIAAAPVLAVVLKPIVVPIFHLIGADPSIFATILLGCDTGGYSLAMELSEDPTIGVFAGLILGSMMGITFVFTIPVALNIIKKEDRNYLGAGVLVGLVTIPVGCIIGGLAMNLSGYSISLLQLISNLVPVIFIAVIMIVGLWFRPAKMIKGFGIFGKGVTAFITCFTVIAVFQYQTGIELPIFNLMVKPNSEGVIPLEDGLLICGKIAIVLIGAFPMVKWITDTFGNTLEKVGNKIKIGKEGMGGIIATCANNIPMFTIMDTMNSKAKIVNVAFAVSAAFVFGDHLGFTAGVNSGMIFPVIIGKLTSGITALLLANKLAPMLLKKIDDI